jgi:hypothetical protein
METVEPTTDYTLQSESNDNTTTTTAINSTAPSTNRILIESKVKSSIDVESPRHVNLNVYTTDAHHANTFVHPLAPMVRDNHFHENSCPPFPNTHAPAPTNAIAVESLSHHPSEETETPTLSYYRSQCLYHHDDWRGTHVLVRGGSDPNLVRPKRRICGCCSDACQWLDAVILCTCLAFIGMCVKFILEFMERVQLEDHFH